jgi:hypothetical protein
MGRSPRTAPRGWHRRASAEPGREGRLWSSERKVVDPSFFSTSCMYVCMYVCTYVRTSNYVRALQRVRIIHTLLSTVMDVVVLASS